ncbi:hypothetical protein VE01_10711, partial [Pseudogymnoascus verrucosus]
MAFHPAQPYALQQHLRDGSMGMGMGRQPGSAATDAYDDFLDQYLTFEDTDAMGGGAAGAGPGAGNGAGAASAVVVHAQSSSSPFLPRSAMGAPHSEPSPPRDTDELILQFPRPPQQSPQHQTADDQQQQQEDRDQDHENDHEHEHHHHQQQQQQPQQAWASFPPTHASPPLRSSRGRRQTFAEHCSARATISDSDLLSLEGIHLKSPRYPPSPPQNPRPSTANTVIGTSKTLNSKASKGSLSGSGPSLRRKKAFSRSSSNFHAKDLPATPNTVTTIDPHIRTPSRSASRGAIRKSVSSINISPAKMQAQSVAALDEWTQRMAVAEAAAFEFGFGQGSGIPMTPPPSARVSDTSSASEREMGGGGGGSRSALAMSHSRSLSQTQLAAMGAAIDQGNLPWTRPPQQQQFTVVRNGKKLHAPAEVGEMKFVDAFSLPYGVGWGGGDFGGVLQGTEQQEEE